MDGIRAFLFSGASVFPFSSARQIARKCFLWYDRDNCYKADKKELQKLRQQVRHGEKEREISSVMRRFLASRKKTLDC